MSNTTNAQVMDRLDKVENEIGEINNALKSISEAIIKLDSRKSFNWPQTIASVIAICTFLAMLVGFISYVVYASSADDRANNLSRVNLLEYRVNQLEKELGKKNGS